MNTPQEKRREILKDLYTNFKTSYPQLNEGKKLSYKYPKKLKHVDLSSKKMAQIPIKEPVKSVLCGTCLGDSSLRINPKYANARVQNRHSSRQASWFFWKWTVCCSEYTNGIDSMTFQVSDGYQKNSSKKLVDLAAQPQGLHEGPDSGSAPGSRILRDEENLGKLKVSTKAHKDLTALHSIICPKNKEKIERSWLNHMTDYFLMVIWLDDGSLYNTHQGCLSLDFFPKEEQEVFVNYLESVWDVKAYLKNQGIKMKDGRDRYKIYIKDQESLLNLLRIVAPLIPVKEMLYKVMFVPFNNKGLLQRWASELVELVPPEFRDYVKKHYETLILGS